MRRFTDLPSIIPIFPIENAFLLPRARLPMNLFEPRYLQMFEDVIKTDDRLIGLSLPDKGNKISDSGLNIIGCAGRIVQFSEAEDGCYLITLYGISRFRLINIVDSFTPYTRAQVNWSGFEQDLNPTDPGTPFNRKKFFRTLEKYFDANRLTADWDTLEQADDELLINSLSMMIDFSPEDRQALLEAPSLQTRRETLMTLIEFALSTGINGDRMQ